MSDADTTTQSSDTKPQQLDTSGEVQPKVGDVTKGLHLDASVDNSDRPKVVRWRVSQNVYGEYKWAPRDDGEWVGYEYYARLAGELEEQVEESRMWMKRCDRRAERVRELEQAILSTLTHLPAENMCHAIEYISQALRGDE